MAGGCEQHTITAMSDTHSPGHKHMHIRSEKISHAHRDSRLLAPGSATVCLNCLVFILSRSPLQPLILKPKKVKQGIWGPGIYIGKFCQSVHRLFRFHASSSAFLSNIFIAIQNTDTYQNQAR